MKLVFLYIFWMWGISLLSLLNDDSFFFSSPPLSFLVTITLEFWDSSLLSLGFSIHWSKRVSSRRDGISPSLCLTKVTVGFSLSATVVSFLYPLNFLSVSWGISTYIHLVNFRSYVNWDPCFWFLTAERVDNIRSKVWYWKPWRKKDEICLFIHLGKQSI